MTGYLVTSKITTTTVVDQIWHKSSSSSQFGCIKEMGSEESIRKEDILKGNIYCVKDTI